MMRKTAAAAALGLAWALSGCASFQPALERLGLRGGSASADRDDAVYQRARVERTAYLELEVERLRADLRQAEEAMVAIESGLRGVHTRADAVSALAEARISVDRATRSVTWRQSEVQEAVAKLEEAERQFQEGHPGSTVFFASRAKRIADTLNDEANKVARTENARFIEAQRVNLREAPTLDSRVLAVLRGSTPVFPERREGAWVLVRTAAGQVGWIHASLLARP